MLIAPAARLCPIVLPSAWHLLLLALPTAFMHAWMIRTWQLLVRVQFSTQARRGMGMSEDSSTLTYTVERYAESTVELIQGDP